MNKVFVLPASEDWIIDRLASEFNRDNKDICVTNPERADIVWILADFCWNHIHPSLLKQKKVITSLHHIVPQKFNEHAQIDFKRRDEITTVYHVPNIHTYNFIRNLTTKPINIIPYWSNNLIFRKTGIKEEFRNKYNLPLDAYICGSFQRDTEGSDLISPKLEKGPDLLALYFAKLKETQKNLHVLLAGWRRQYVISRLKELDIDFTYIEKPSHQVINELYQTLDLYPVTSRAEGGPQSLLEAGMLNIPVISRDIGMASAVLPASAIADDVFNAIPAIPNVEHLKLPAGYRPYRDLIASL